MKLTNACVQLHGISTLTQWWSIKTNPYYGILRFATKEWRSALQWSSLSFLFEDTYMAHHHMWIWLFEIHMVYPQQATYNASWLICQAYCPHPHYIHYSTSSGKDHPCVKHSLLYLSLRAPPAPFLVSFAFHISLIPNGQWMHLVCLHYYHPISSSEVVSAIISFVRKYPLSYNQLIL